MSKELIMCAAIHVQDEFCRTSQPINIKEGIVLCGYRHDSCLVAMQELYDYNIKVYPVRQGFLTSHNRFVDRKEAATIAYNAQQITEQATILCSEMLYPEHMLKDVLQKGNA